MTDKQIKEVFKNGFYCIEPCPEIKELLAELKAKEQECEGLKKQYNCYACDTCKGKEDYINLKRHCENAIKSLHNKYAELDQLKAENVELKKWKEAVVELFERTCRCKYLNEENAHCSFYNRECIGLNQCVYKNQQTLIEIKKIAEKIDDSDGCAYGDYDCNNCSSLEQETVCTYKVKKLILQKISEVEV